MLKRMLREMFPVGVVLAVHIYLGAVVIGAFIFGLALGMAIS